MTVKPIHGKARKFSLLAVIVSAIGWVIFIAFFGLASLDVYGVCNNELCTRVDAFFIPHWVFLVTGVLLYLSAVLNLVFNGLYYLAVVTQFLVAIFLMSAGAIIYSDWIVFYIPLNDIKYLFEFGACSLSVVALIISVLLWPLFSHIGKTSTMMLTEPDGGAQEEGTLQTISMKQLDPANNNNTETQYTETPSTQLVEKPQMTESASAGITNPIPQSIAPSLPLATAGPIPQSVAPSLPLATAGPIPQSAAPSLPLATAGFSQPPHHPHSGSQTQTSHVEEIIYQEPEQETKQEGKKNVRFEEIYDNAEPTTEGDDEYVITELEDSGGIEMYMDMQGGGEQTEDVMYEDPKDFRERSDSPEQQYDELS